MRTLVKDKEKTITVDRPVVTATRHADVEIPLSVLRMELGLMQSALRRFSVLPVGMRLSYFATAPTPPPKMSVSVKKRLTSNRQGLR